MINPPGPNFAEGFRDSLNFQAKSSAATGMPQKFYFNDKMLVFSSSAELARLRQS